MSDVTTDSVDTVVYDSVVTQVGGMVEEFLGHGLLIFFKAGSPPELHDMSVLHEATTADDGPHPGDTIHLGDVALEVLAVPYGYATRVTHHPWAAILDAYAAVWADLLDRDALEALMAPAMVTHAVNRSFTWLGAVRGASPDELAEWGDSPLYYLRLVHEPFPPLEPEHGP